MATVTVDTSIAVSATNFHTIQAAVNAAVAGDTIQVAPGTYNENVLITKSLTMISTGGAEDTIINGSQGGATKGTITVAPNVNNVTIGDADAGFTVNGIDGPNAGAVSAAIYLDGNHNNVTIEGNTVVAVGDAGLYGTGSNDNITVDGNTFSGQTFTGLTPSGGNPARSLVQLGSNGGSSDDIDFVNNTVSGTAGGGASGNYLVQIDADGSVVNGNTFSGFTTGVNAQVRIQEDDTDVTGNTFSQSGSGAIGVEFNLSGGEDEGTVTENAYLYNEGNDTFSLTPGNDTVDGGDGTDTLQLSTGFGTQTNLVYLQSGYVYSTVTGFDTILNIENVRGSGQDDTIIGNADDNTIYSSGGSDVIDGGDGTDTFDTTGTNSAVVVILDYGTATGAVDATLDSIENVTTGNGADLVIGDDGANVLRTGGGNDVSNGRAGDDSMDGGSGNDRLFGEEGDDTLVGGSGNDSQDGGEGNDLLIGGSGADELVGGDGIDTVDYSASSNGVNANLGGTGSGGDAQGDTYSGVENVVGSNHNDTITGDDADNELSGGLGNDNLNGGAGDDTIDHGVGNDAIDGGDGDGDVVIFEGDWADYTITLNNGTYTITDGTFTDTVTGVETFVFNGVEVDVSEDPNVIVTAESPEVVSIVEDDEDADDGYGEDADPATLEVDEDAAEDTVVATVTATDANLPAGDSLTFELVDGMGDPYSGPFEITQTGDGTADISLTGALDFLTESSYTLTVKITDGDGQSTTQVVTINVLDINDAPTDITFDDDTPTIDENEDGAVVTALAGVDQNPADTLTYSVDDTRFEVVLDGSDYVLKLKAGETLDHETEDEVTVEMTVTDSKGETHSEEITIAVADVNEVPTDIEVSPEEPSVDENADGATVATLVATDVDEDETFTYSVDDSRFEVVVDEGAYVLKLKEGETLDFETETSVDVEVTVEDSGGLTYSETVTVTVNDVNEVPTDITFGNDTPAVDEALDGAEITTLEISDPDAGDSFTFAVDDARFEVVEDEGEFVLRLKAGEVLDYEAATSVTVEVTVTDSGGLTRTEEITITVNAVNEAPGNGDPLATWTPAPVETGRRAAVLFPEAVVVDPEGDAMTYTLETGPTAGKLMLNGVAITVGQELTEAEFHALTYRSPAEGDYTAVFTVSDGEHDVELNVALGVTGPVNDTVLGTAAGEELDGGAGNDTIRGGMGDDSLYGGQGDDLANGGRGADNLQGNGGGDVLSGGRGADTLAGGFGADQLRGQLGADQIFGGQGHDLLNGGDGSDMLSGGEGNDTIRGGEGRDVLNGGLGNDLLAGGNGADVFVFDAMNSDNVDTISDFDSIRDQIHLSKAVFAALGDAVGAGEFRLGTAAQDANDRLIYDQATGHLYYDADGVGGTGKRMIAILEPETVLSVDHFSMI
jgi:Ca2+-binding RTX toxin-like protein